MFWCLQYGNSDDDGYKIVMTMAMLMAMAMVMAMAMLMMMGNYVICMAPYS